MGFSRLEVGHGKWNDFGMEAGRSSWKLPAFDRHSLLFFGSFKLLISAEHNTHTPAHARTHTHAHMHTRRGRANGRNGKITFAGSKKSTIPY